MTQMTNPWPSRWTRALRVESWRSKNGNVRACAKKTDSLCAHKLFRIVIHLSWHPDYRKTNVCDSCFVAGLTYEEICSFEPPLFDGSDMDWRRSHARWPQPYTVLRTLFLRDSVKLSCTHVSDLCSLSAEETLWCLAPYQQSLTMQQEINHLSVLSSAYHWCWRAVAGKPHFVPMLYTDFFFFS